MSDEYYLLLEMREHEVEVLRAKLHQAVDDLMEIDKIRRYKNYENCPCEDDKECDHGDKYDEILKITRKWIV
jgi:hypothetical protein